MRMHSFLSFLMLVCSSSLAFSADFNGDGTDDVAVFRPGNGLWAIRGITRVYFGKASDSPVIGDYTGDGTDEIGVFRDATHLWAIKGLTRIYYGSYGDIPVNKAGDADVSGTGIYSTVIGNNANASGIGSLAKAHAQHYGAEASGEYSTAIGNGTLASGICSTARGCVDDDFGPGLTKASGDYSTAIGVNAQATGYCSLAVGSYVRAGGFNTALIGSFAEFSDSVYDTFFFGFGEEGAPVNVDQSKAAIFYGVDVGVGTVSPARSLHVKDVIRLEPRSSAPSNPSRGDLYYDSTDDKLKCYDGSIWQNCF